MTSVLAYGVFNALGPTTSAVLAILYTSILTFHEYGMYGVLTALYAMLCMVMDCGLPGAIVRNFFNRKDDGRSAGDYFTSIISGSRLLSLVLLPALWLLLHPFYGVLNIQREAFVPLLLIAAYFDRAAENFAAICRAMERPFHYAAGRAAGSVATIAAAIVFVYEMHWGLVGALLANAVGRACSSLIYLLVMSDLVKITSFRFAWSDLREALSFGLPLVPNRVASWARLVAQRPVLSQLVPLRAVGLFTFASSVAVLPQLVSSAIDLALTPIYLKRRASGDKEFREKVTDFSRVYLGLLFPVWTIVLVFCPELISFVTHGRYTGASGACAVLLCASFVRIQQSFMSRQIQHLGRTWLLPLISIPSALVSLAITVAFAAQYGIVAAAVATAISELLLFAMLAIAITRYEPLDYPLGYALFLAAVMGALALWVVLGEPLPAAGAHLALKSALAIVAVVSSLWFWVWPRRDFIVQLARG